MTEQLWNMGGVTRAAADHALRHSANGVRAPGVTRLHPSPPKIISIPLSIPFLLSYSVSRLTAPSRPNKVGLKCPPVLLPVHKKFLRFQ